MKKAKIFTILGTFVLAGLFLVSCVKDETKFDLVSPQKSLKTTEDSYLPIYMGQNTLIGQAFITLNEDYDAIIVEVSLNDGITPNAAHLYAGVEPPPSSAPGQFPYHWFPGDPFPVMFTIDISEWYDCESFDWYFALHFEIGNETAWILPDGGINWYNKKGKKIGWGQYFLHSFEGCERPIER